DDIEALADPGLIRLAGIDRLAKGILLPGVRRDDPSHLSGQVDPGRRAKAVLLRPMGEALDPEHSCELEEERVARMGEPEANRDAAPAAMVPFPEFRPAEQQVRMRLDARLGRDLVIGERA